MSNEWVLINREALLAELRQVFDARTAEALLRVLDKVAVQVHQAGVTREDFRELKQIVVGLAEAQRRTAEEVKELAEAQRRTAEEVKELAEAQRRTAEEVKELAEAQRRTELRVGDLESAVERMAEAQRRTTEEMKELAEAQRHAEERVGDLESAVFQLTEGIDRLRKQVGGLSDTVGGDIEDIAYIVLYDVLKREFGWQVGVLERSWQTWDDEPEEVNVFGMATDAARPGTTIWIVGEAKHNLTAKEVARFIRQAERARRRLVGEVFPVCFCYRARPEVQQMVRDAGIRLVFSYGKLV